MSPSIQALIEEFENAVFQKLELEYHDNWTLIELSSRLVNPDFKSHEKNNFDDF